MNTYSKAVLYGAYWTAIATLVGAMGFYLGGYFFTGTDFVYTAMKILILGLFVCLGIEINDKMKENQEK